MTNYSLDTNIVLRFSNPSDEQHLLVTEAVATLLMHADECYLTAQVLIELWVVATRPIDVNGLGWSVEQTHNITLNLDDFTGIPGITVVHPQEVIAADMRNSEIE